MSRTKPYTRTREEMRQGIPPRIPTTSTSYTNNSDIRRRYSEAKGKRPSKLTIKAIKRRLNRGLSKFLGQSL